MDEDALRREGAADAVIRIVASKTLLSPWVRSTDVAQVLGLSMSDLKAALVRYRETVDEPKPPSQDTVDRHLTPVDRLCLKAVKEIGRAGPAQVQAWIVASGRSARYPTVVHSLRKLLSMGHLTQPSYGRYRAAG